MARGSGAAAATIQAGGVRDGTTFLAVSALLFLASVAVTAWSSGFMSGGMPMPGGWTMSMAWMRMPGQSWPGAAALFVATWVVMMVAMMLPALVPMLSSYRRSISVAGAAHRGGLTALVGGAYFLPWAIVGAASYPIGVAVAALAMRWPALARFAPLATGIVVLLAGLFQLSGMKARQLRCCREAARLGPLPPDARTAWRIGFAHGARCCACCAGFTAVLLVVGVMDLRAMSALAIAITVERLARWEVLAVRAVGVALVAAGAIATARAIAGA
jgi:predicted metal-binding membrane protein